MAAAQTFAPAILAGNSFRLADRVKIQAAAIRARDYIVFGRLTAVHWAAPRDTTGLSQSRPRWTNAGQEKAVNDAVAQKIITAGQGEALKPFSEKQNILWQSTTLDWLDAKRGPLIARSKDCRDWLLPEGMRPLPAIPDPRFVPSHALAACPRGAGGCKRCIAPRIPQTYTDCPLVGDRVQHKITSRDGYTMGILHPILELSIVQWASDGSGHFVRLRGGEDNVDRSMPALLLDDDNRGFFVGGIFA